MQPIVLFLDLLCFVPRLQDHPVEPLVVSIVFFHFLLVFSPPLLVLFLDLLCFVLRLQEQKGLLQQYYVPYRNQVTQYVHELIAKHGRLIHLSIHSFTPNLAGKIRQGDIGLLYDPQRAEEKSLCLHWQNLLKQKAPHYRVRRNYPYQGVSDSIMRPFRREYSSKKYIGIELESNQAILQGDQSRFHTRILVQTLASRIG